MSLLVFLALYVILFFAALAGAMVWLRRQRRPRLPFQPERARLLRGPGESLRQRVEAMDEELIALFGALMALPLLAGLGLWQLLRGAGVGSEAVQMGFALLVTATLLWVGTLLLGRKGLRRGNHYLGYFGERMIAEEIDALRLAGWRIFHDVPAEQGNFEFNIDHVAVGPGGVFAIEAKMRRQGTTRPGYKPDEVIHDGQKLVWPWGEDDFGLRQAERNARWLHDWLSLIAGVEIEVVPVLALPGWRVHERVRGPVRVKNPSALIALLTERAGTLSAGQIDRLAQKLDERCRDVTY